MIRVYLANESVMIFLWISEFFNNFNHFYDFQMMPKVASEIAEPLSKANKITMISDGSGDIGAAKLTGELFFFSQFFFVRFNFGFNLLIFTFHLIIFRGNFGHHGFDS